MQRVWDGGDVFMGVSAAELKHHRNSNGYKNVSRLVVQYVLFLTELQTKYIFMLSSLQCIKNSFQDIKDIGFLQVKVLKAVDLLAADFAGILFPFSSI